MGKRCRESDCDCAAAATVEYKTVFVDTNLDTHLAIRASGSETLSDIKEKLVLQHMELFPTVGEIKIHSLKVKRRSNFYYLPNIMLLSNAFEGFNGNWYLYVDASSALKHNELDSVDCVKEKDADDCRGMVCAVKQMETYPVALPKDANARNEVSEVASGVKFAKSLEKYSGTFSEEHCMETEPPAKKKRKMKHAVDVRHDESNVKATTANSKLDYVKGKENAVELTLNAGLDCSMRSLNATDVKEDMKSEGNKRKEEDSRMAPEIICKTHVEQTGKGVLAAPTVEAPERGSGSKKKIKKGIKKNKNMEGEEKSRDVYPENSGTERSIDGSATDLISEASDKKGSTLHGEGQDVPMNLLDGSSKYASEKIQVADKDVVLTQSSQTLDDIASTEKIVKTQSSLGNAIDDFAPVEEELHRGFNQVEKNGKIMEDNNKIVKKRKRVKLSTSDVKMKDSHDIMGLSSNVKGMDALPMNLSSSSHEKNQLSSNVKNEQLNSKAKAESIYLNSNKSKEDVVLGDTMPENLVASNLESNPGTGSLGISSNEVLDRNTILIGGSGPVENGSSNTSKKKKKSHKLAAEIQDNTYTGQTVNVEITKLYTETHKPEENQEEKSIPLDYNREVIIPSIKTDLDTAVAESVIACGIKKKKKKNRGGNSADSTLAKFGNEQSINGISGSSGLCSSSNNIPEAGGKEKDTLPHKEQDVQLKLLDSSPKGASEQVQDAEENEANLVVSTQNSQISEDVALAYKIVENTQSDQTTENRDKKSKRRKKVQHAVSYVTENPPVKVQNAAVEVSPTEESLGDPVRSEKEERPVGLSSALSNKSEGKFDKINSTDSNTADLSRASENEDGGINLKQHHQCLDKDSGNEEKKATKSSSKKIEKGVQQNALLPPTSMSTKSFDNKGSEDQFCIRKSSGRRPGNSIHKTVQDEVILNSSTIVSGVEVKDSTPNEMRQMEGLQESVQVHASPPCPKNLNISLKKSSLGRSERRGNKRTQTDAAKKMVMKTHRKKSLLIKPGAIFQDDSGESSGDENEIPYSASSTHRPSDGLALSSDSESEGESDLSQESNRNGLDDAKDQLTAVKSATKLDNLSDSGEVTMDMILRSSKRFKNAKLLASQNEDLEPIEYVPESQLD